MGHAGALTTSGGGGAEAKIEEALKAAGVRIAANASVVGSTIRDAMSLAAA